MSKAVSSGVSMLADDEDGNSNDVCTDGEGVDDESGKKIKMGRKKRRMVNHGLRF